MNSSELEHFVKFSKYAGERLDLVQAGGGNTSVKFNNGQMAIKASGYFLSEVEKDKAYSLVYTQEVADTLSNEEVISNKDKKKRETLAASIVKNATIDTENKPSIETLLHAILLKYTLHTHSIIVNRIAIKKNWEQLFTQLFPEAICVKYETPGIDLAIALKEAMDKKIAQGYDLPKIYFLQNHGLITTSNDPIEVYELHEYVTKKLELFLKVDYTSYRNCNHLTHIFRECGEKEFITSLCEDQVVYEAISNEKISVFKFPYCPDVFVFLGVHLCDLTKDARQVIKDYFHKFNEYPKVVLYNQKVYFRGKSVKKTKEMEDVLKFHILSTINNTDNSKPLDIDEIGYLANWEAEKFRQNI